MQTNLRPINEEGLPHGLWEIYFSNGQLDFRGEHVNGLQHGFVESYCGDGVLHYKGTYDMGKRVGFWIFGRSALDGARGEYFYAN